MTKSEITSYDNTQVTKYYKRIEEYINKQYPEGHKSCDTMANLIDYDLSLHDFILLTAEMHKRLLSEPNL